MSLNSLPAAAADAVAQMPLAQWLARWLQPRGNTLTWSPAWHTRDRLRDDAPLRRDNGLSWLITALMTLLAFGIRFPNLARPPIIMFDETYYAKEAWSVLHFGYAKAWPDGADQSIVNGITNGWQTYPDGVVHPQMAKYLIAAGEWLFGMNSFGWRFMACICGALLVTATVRLARRLSRSTLIGALAGFLLCVDGLDYVMSRIALLDVFQAMFTVAAVAAVVADRDWFRNKLARYLDKNNLTSLNGQFGPLIWWRPWRLGAGLLFGLACGCKWNSMYVLAIMGVLSVVFDWRARRTAGARTAAWQSLYKDAPLAFLWLVAVAVVTYVATWAGWLLTSGGYDRQWAVQHPHARSVTLLDGVFGHHVGNALASLWQYNKWIWDFHTGTWIASQTHPYNAYPAGWLFVSRTIGIEATLNIPPGTPGCPADATANCVQTWFNADNTTTSWIQLPGTAGCPTGTSGTCQTIVTGLGTPLLWWMAAIALVAGLIFWVFGRDWRFAVPVLGMAATWIGWFPNADRPVFFFYAIMMIPFTATILAMCFGKILGPPGRRRWRRNGALIVGICVVAITLDFAFILPILNDTTMPMWAWQLRMWFRGWV